MDGSALEDRIALAAIGFEDPVWFCRTILPHWFSREIPWFGRGLLALMLRKTNFLKKYGELDKIVKYFVWRETPQSEPQPLFRLTKEGDIILVASHQSLWMVPRGFGKTTLCRAAVIFLICYKIKNCIGYVSETARHAEMQLINIRSELETNPIIAHIFGTMRPVEREGSKWTEDILMCLNGVVLFAKGRGAQIRGTNIGGNRPDLLIGDDLEDKESVATELQRGKTLDWFLADFIPARADVTTDFWIIGTLLGTDSLLDRLRQDPQWNTVILSAVLEDGSCLWEEKMSKAQLERERGAYARQARLSLFYMEYYNTIRGEDGNKFLPRHIIIPDFFDPDNYPRRSIACDPAISGKADADFFALGVVGMSAKGGRFAVLETWGGRGIHPRAQVDWFFKLAAKWNCEKHGVEAIAYQQALVHLLREEMFRKRQYFEIEEIRHGKVGKIPRVEGILVPRYSAGYIVHARHFPELEAGLLDWPNGKLDFPDVIAMAISLLDVHAASASGRDLGEDEYQPLSNDYFSAPQVMHGREGERRPDMSRYLPLPEKRVSTFPR